jgi:hypothetical protein
MPLWRKAEGASGILFFRLGCEHDREERKLAGELRFLSNALIFGRIQPWGETDGDAVALSRAWNFDANLDGIPESYLVTVNVSEEKQTWKRKLPADLQDGTVHLLFGEGGEVQQTLDQPQWQIDLNPLQAKVWRLLPKRDSAVSGW